MTVDAMTNAGKHVRIANDTQKIYSSNWLTWRSLCIMTLHNFLLFSDQTSLKMVWQMGCGYIKFGRGHNEVWIHSSSTRYITGVMNLLVTATGDPAITDKVNTLTINIQQAGVNATFIYTFITNNVSSCLVSDKAWKTLFLEILKFWIMFKLSLTRRKNTPGIKPGPLCPKPNMQKHWFIAF